MDNIETDGCPHLRYIEARHLPPLFNTIMAIIFDAGK